MYSVYSQDLRLDKSREHVTIRAVPGRRSASETL